jgi:WD40 repeat protein
LKGNGGTVTITSVEFLESGDLISGDSEGKITIWSVDGDGVYMPNNEFQAHDKSISCLTILSEGTLVSGGEMDRYVRAWEPHDNYGMISQTKV